MDIIERTLILGTVAAFWFHIIADIINALPVK